MAEHHTGVADVREFVRTQLAQWRYRGRRDDVVLIASEMVTNALLHGEGEPVLRLSGSAWQVRVEVSDDSPTLPAVRQAGSDGGWGLRLLDQLSAGWGAFPQGIGKVVWCELRTALAPV